MRQMGGLYAEMVQNRSFEFSGTDHPSYHSLTAWERIGQEQEVTLDAREGDAVKKFIGRIDRKSVIGGLVEMSGMKKKLEINSRKTMEELMLMLLNPLKPYYSEEKAFLRLGVNSAHFPDKSAWIEGFSRPLWGLAPFWPAGERMQNLKQSTAGALWQEQIRNRRSTGENAMIMTSALWKWQQWGTRCCWRQSRYGNRYRKKKKDRYQTGSMRLTGISAVTATGVFFRLL